jgi:polysaccharide deacetylase 2 family uncharacterized protein YibQ
MSDGLRLRRQDEAAAPRGGSASHVAQAYGATQARTGPGTKIPAASGKAAKAGGGVANWPLWIAAVALLGGGVTLGSMLGGGPQFAAQPPRLISVVQPAQASAPAAKLLTTHAEPHLNLPTGWNPAQRVDPADQRPALAPPPPPAAMVANSAIPESAPAAPAVAEKPIAAEAIQAPAMPPSSAPMQQVAALPPAPLPKAAAPAKPAALPLPPQTLPHVMPLSGTERWRQLAAPMPSDAKAPYIAIIIDDMGLDRRNSARAANIPGPLTLSFMSYANELAEQSAAARAKGHEVMLHLPMEPLDAKRNDPGPNALYVGMDETELRRRLNWSLDRFDDYAGVNNHMGSRFTADPRGMAIVLDELQKRGRFWLDSHTGPHSAGLSLAAKRGLAATGRDLFLDDERQAGGVAAQLAALERIARANGDAIGIGHPHGATLEALERWVLQAKARGFSLVPVTTILRNRSPERVASN